MRYKKIQKERLEFRKGRRKKNKSFVEIEEEEEEKEKNGGGSHLLHSIDIDEERKGKNLEYI